MSFKDRPPSLTNPTLCPFISYIEGNLYSSNILGFVALHRQAWLATRGSTPRENWPSSQQLTIANGSLANGGFK